MDGASTRKAGKSALEMKNQGLQVLAIDFRGYGKSKPGKKAKALEFDVLAAIDYLKGEGAERVSLLGASMGGGAVGRAVVKAKADAVGRVVLLAAAPPVDNPKKLKGNKLFVVSEGDYFAKSTLSNSRRRPVPSDLRSCLAMLMPSTSSKRTKEMSLQKADTGFPYGINQITFQRSMKKALVFLFLCGLVLNSLFSDSHERPNIVYIMSDELAYFEVSYMGEEKLKTPRLTVWRKEGIRFDRAYAASPVCLRSAAIS